MKLPILAAAASLAACATANPDARAPAAAAPFASLTSEDFSDLAPLRARLDGVRIVQLGESSHGAAEYSRAKVRLIKFLHEEMGFDVIAFESSPYQCARADARAADASSRETLMGCVFGVWHTEEVLELFDYLKATRATDRPLHLAGYDIQPIGPNKADRPAYLAGVVAALDPDYAKSVRALDQEFLDAYAGGGNERRAYFRAHRDRLIAGYADLHAFLVQNENLLMAAHAGGVDPDAPLIARQTAWFLGQYVRQQTSATNRAHAENRDWGMAENLTFLAETLYPDSKIIAWAHNAHVRHANETIDLSGVEEPRTPARGAGGWLKARYGDALFTVGVYAAAGEMTRNDREAVAVSPALPGSLEAQPIPDAAPGVLFLKPTDGSADPLWTEPTTAKYWGQGDLPLTLADQYDAVLLLRTANPPVYLYEH